MRKSDMNRKSNIRIDNIDVGFSDYLKEQNVKAFYEFDKFEFMAPSKDGLGLGETNVLVVEKEIQQKNGKKIPIFEFYKDGQLIASTNGRGKLNLSSEYKESLKSRLKRLL